MPTNLKKITDKIMDPRIEMKLKYLEYSEDVLFLLSYIDKLKRRYKGIRR